MVGGVTIGAAGRFTTGLGSGCKRGDSFLGLALDKARV